MDIFVSWALGVRASIFATPFSIIWSSPAPYSGSANRKLQRPMEYGRNLLSLVQINQIDNCLGGVGAVFHVALGRGLDADHPRRIPMLQQPSWPNILRVPVGKNKEFAMLFREFGKGLHVHWLVVLQCHQQKRGRI